MIMNKAKEILFSLSSLSIFRGILNRSVPKAYYKLLNSMDKKPEEFLNAYGEFFSLISERGCSNRLAYAFTEAALFDENCFTRAAAAGKYNTLPDNLLKAVKRDCQAILNAASLTSQELIQCYCASNDLATVADMGYVAEHLPKWECGECAESFKMFDGSLEKVAKYYKENVFLPVIRRLFGVTAIFSLFCTPIKLIWIHLQATKDSVTSLSAIQNPLLRVRLAITACFTAIWVQVKVLPLKPLQMNSEKTA